MLEYCFVPIVAEILCRVFVTCDVVKALTVPDEMDDLRVASDQHWSHQQARRRYVVLRA